METCPYLDEVRAEARAEAKAEVVREVVFRLGRIKFGKAPTRKQRKTVQAMTGLDQLHAVAVRLLEVDSWANLLSGIE
jgi:hypothetical protein